MAGIVITVGIARPRIRDRTSATVRGLLQAGVGLAVIVAVAVRLGAAPFLDAFRAVDAWTFLAAAAIAAGTTACCAYRWQVISRALGVPVSFSRAVPAYYRSQLLNATLPGGILGDVHRGLRQQDEGQPLVRALRAIAWERVLGQAVSVLLAAGALLAVPSPLNARIPVDVRIGSLLAMAVALGMVLARARRRRSAAPGSVAGRHARPSDPRARGVGRAAGGRIRGHRARGAVAADWRAIRSHPRALSIVTLTSAGAVAGHVGVFLLAARAVGADIPPAQVIQLTLVVLVVAALPLSLAGWGPREGATAWLFALSGLGAAQGLSVSVLYGALALVGTLPGAVVLLARRRGGRHG